MMSSVKLTPHDARIAVAIKSLWDTEIQPRGTTQVDFGKKYGFEQSFISNVMLFRSAATHAIICAIAKEMGVEPLKIDPLFNEPNRFRR